MPQKYISSKGNPSWSEVVNEKGAVESVISSALIVIGITLIIYAFAYFIIRKKKKVVFSNAEQIYYLVIICLGMIFIAIVTDLIIFAVPPFLILIVVLLVRAIPEPVSDTSAEFLATIKPNRPFLIYDGSNLDFSTSIIETVLNKHSPFFIKLSDLQKKKFTQRIIQFIAQKQFIIHDNSGFREMPILVSASAVQFSFGLSNFLLPSFSEIHIHPKEFLSVNHTIRIVSGNVSNNRIQISWKHFLDGFMHYSNGENVGLHEMAHAYQYQNFNTDFGNDLHFKNGYLTFKEFCTHLNFPNPAGYDTLFTEYGRSCEDELWAESIEIFFEKPFEFEMQFPELCQIITSTLNYQEIRKLQLTNTPN